MANTHSLAEVEKFWRKLRGHVTLSLVERGDHLLASAWQIENAPAIRQKTAFLKELLKNKHQIALKGGVFGFRNFYDMTVQLEEVICNVQYRFETKRPKPFIVDAGGCYGLASYWLSRRHPDAAILTFEPNPDNASLIRENIARIGMANVNLSEAAVGANDGYVEFYDDASMPMGSSTFPRLKSTGHALKRLTVPQVDLANCIDKRHVDFLKLDVEGAEYSIIEALDGRMDGVQRMFIELHFGVGLPKSNLSNLLSILDRNGFDHMITRAGNASPPHPLAAQHNVWQGSLNLWAQRA